MSGQYVEFQPWMIYFIGKDGDPLASPTEIDIKGKERLNERVEEILNGESAMPTELKGNQVFYPLDGEVRCIEWNGEEWIAYSKESVAYYVRH